MLGNCYKLMLYAGVETMSNSMHSRVVVHSVVGCDAATEVAAAAEGAARVQSPGLTQNQARCTHSEKTHCWGDTHRQNVNRQTRTADQDYREHIEDALVDHAFGRMVHRKVAQKRLRKRHTHASYPEWRHIQTHALSLGHRQH